MIPIRDDNPHFLTPWITIGLIAVNIAVWILVQGLGTEPRLSTSICTLGLIPADVFNQVPTTPVTCPVEAGGWHTLVTSMFMHGGWMHLIGNLWFLWIFGNNIEDSMGHWRFAVFYLLCGLAAALGQTALNPGSAIPMVGASGAISGVMGAYVILFPRVHVHMLVFLGFFVTVLAVPAILMLGYWIGLQLLGGLMSSQLGGVAYWAHIGGFIAGSALVLVFRDRRLLARHPYRGWRRQALPTRNWQRLR